MSVTLIGCGCGMESLSMEAAVAIEQAEVLIGAARLLEPWQGVKPCVEAVAAKDIAAAIDSRVDAECCVLFSGDSGFYSGARLLLPLLGNREVKVLPGLSSLQVFAARLGRPWQNWRLCSAHGAACDAVYEVCQGSPVFFLTGGKSGPSALCKALTDAGLGFLEVSVGENLGGEEERIIRTTAKEAAAGSFAPLSILLAEPAPRAEKRTPGLPDTAFQRAGQVPMTKREIRAAALALLAPGPEDVCWDVGAGTGSVAIELALQARAVCAVERNADALAVAEENRKALGAWNLRLVAGAAPEVLDGLPAPDAVFVGGSGGKLREILETVHSANPAARICVSAIALETLHTACFVLRELGYETEVCQIAVSRSRNAGELTLMLAQNPIWLITGTKA